LTNWRKIVWWIGWVFKFPPDNIWNMFLDEFEFWADGVIYFVQSDEE
jgi:hypothetical protein